MEAQRSLLTGEADDLDVGFEEEAERAESDSNDLLHFLASANLEGAILTGADLQDADLRGANLRNADLTYCNLWGADLRGTNCDGTKFYPCQMPKHAGKLWGAKITELTDLDMPPPAKFRWW